MTAKEYLKQIQLLEEKINQKKKELEDLESRRTVISAVDYSKERTSGSRLNEAAFVKLSDKIIDLSSEINQEIGVFVEEKHKIIDQIQQLKDIRLIRVLYKRYVEYKGLEDIADEMNYTYPYIIELHTIALKKFEISYKNLLKF